MSTLILKIILIVSIVVYVILICKWFACYYESRKLLYHLRHRNTFIENNKTKNKKEYMKWKIKS